MPLGQGITEMWQAVRDRVEVSGEGVTWKVTAGSFDSALAYARRRFGDPAVLSRSDQGRRWPRVTLTVTNDPALAGAAPPLEQLAVPTVPPKATARSAPADRRVADAEETAVAADHASGPADQAGADQAGLPPSLEAIFAHQEELRLVRQRRPDHDTHGVTHRGAGTDASTARTLEGA